MGENFLNKTNCKVVFIRGVFLFASFCVTVIVKSLVSNKKERGHHMILSCFLALVAIYIAYALIHKYVLTSRINPTGKHVLVTGAASGVGAALAKVCTYTHKGPVKLITMFLFLFEAFGTNITMRRLCVRC